MYDHRDIALKARDFVVLIEGNRDVEITFEWTDLLTAVREAFNGDHPEITEWLRLLKLAHPRKSE